MTRKLVFEGLAEEESWDLFNGISIELNDGRIGEYSTCQIMVDGIEQFIGKKIRVTIERI